MTEIPVEEAPAARESYDALLARLSRQSVHKRYEAYRDIDWDAPEMRIDPADPRFELPPADPLGATAWYRAQPASLRARIGLHRLATFMKVGLQFENVLSQGLLRFALARDPRSPEHRYAYHELIEESQHSMMFAEFVRRTGFDVPGVPGGGARLGSLVVSTEEARHLCFARSFLREHVPRLPRAKRAALALAAPAVLRLTAELMLRPSPSLVREFAIPRAVVDEAFRDNPAYRAMTMASLGKVRALIDELGLITPAVAPLWRTLGAAA
jgi:P-aminobenzoate N-oxygenase AurF